MMLPPPVVDVDLTAMDFDFDAVQKQIEALLASGDRSHAAQRALMYLQHLLMSARPDATVLLANYPNPFNPETWIPYHLASSTDVTINIYNAQGILVRALTLGHQSAVTTRVGVERHIGDGRNAVVNVLRVVSISTSCKRMRFHRCGRWLF